MAGEYKVGIELNIQGDAQAKLAGVFKVVTDLARITKEATEQLDKMAAALKGLSGTSRSLNSIASAMDKLSASGGATGRLSEQMDAVAKSSELMLKTQREMGSVLADNARLGRDLANSMKQGSRAGGMASGGHGGHGDGMLAAAGAAGLGEGTWDITERALKAQGDFLRARGNALADDRLTAAQRGQLDSQTDVLVRSIPGSTKTQIAQAAGKLREVLGSFDEAMGQLPTFVQFLVNSQKVDIKNNGDAGGDPDVAAVKAAELLGRLTNERGQISPTGLMTFLNGELAVEQATNGMVNPKMMLTFSKSAGVAGMRMSDDFLLTELPSLLQMKGARAGTEAAAFYAQMATGVMTKPIFQKLQAAGIYDHATWGHGRVNDPTKHLVDNSGDLLASDPIQWINRELMPRLAGMTKSQALGVVAALFGKQTSQRWAAEGVAALPTITKDAQNIKNTPADIGAYQDQNNAYYVNVLKMHAAENEMMVQLGAFLMGPAIDAMTHFTSALHDLTDWAKANPGLAKNLSETAIGLGLIGGALGALYLAVLPFVAWGKLISSGGGLIGSAFSKVFGSGAAKVAEETGPRIAGRLAAGAAIGQWIPGVGLVIDAAAALAIGSHYETPASRAALADLDKQRRSLVGGPNGPTFDEPPGGWGSVATPTAKPNMNIQLHGDVNLDGKKVGSLVAEGMADASRRPSASINGMNLNLHPFGAEVGAGF